jgi:hypothetical protein
MIAIRFVSVPTKAPSLAHRFAHRFGWACALGSVVASSLATAALAGSSGTHEPSCEFRLASQGRLDGTATDAPLSLVLQELAEATGIDVVGEDAKDRSRVSFSFRGVEIPEALVRILSGRSYTISAKLYGEALRVVGVVIDGTSMTANHDTVDEGTPSDDELELHAATGAVDIASDERSLE